MGSAEHTHLHCLPSQYNEALRPLHHETRELVAKNSLNLVGLLDLDAQANRVDRWFNQHTLILVS